MKKIIQYISKKKRRSTHVKYNKLFLNSWHGVMKQYSQSDILSNTRYYEYKIKKERYKFKFDMVMKGYKKIEHSSNFDKVDKLWEESRRMYKIYQEYWNKSLVQLSNAELVFGVSTLI